MSGPTQTTGGLNDEAKIHGFQTLGGEKYEDPEHRQKELNNHLAECAVKLQQKRVDDVNDRLKQRPIKARELLLLLLFQNFVVFGLVLFSQRLGINPYLLGIIVPATLGETAFMVHKVVDFAFREIDYKVPNT